MRAWVLTGVNVKRSCSPLITSRARAILRNRAAGAYGSKATTLCAVWLWPPLAFSHTSCIMAALHLDELQLMHQPYQKVWLQALEDTQACIITLVKHPVMKLPCPLVTARSY